MTRQTGALLIVAAIAIRSVSALPHVVTEFTFTQPEGISAWDTWNFFSAGSFIVPQQWLETSIRWKFDGAVDAWYFGQVTFCKNFSGKLLGFCKTVKELSPLERFIVLFCWLLQKPCPL